uniref:U-box domain-containing protein n=1 Tax=Tetradesmus obliquus TaxID=3088 RepID=A0A383VC19_TETOB|eukprot:jgi/Sobl393_1/3637/SZX62309.1
MGDSLRPYLKMQNLFCRDIDRNASPSLVRDKLERMCPLGKVVLPIDHNNPNSHIGSAYLNYNTHDEAKKALTKYRFAVVFNGHPAKLMYSALDKDRVFGPFSLKFQIIIKNLSEEVDVEMLYDFFSQFGEIYQCKTDTDLYHQYFGQVTYMDEDSVEAAVAGANQTRWQSSVIVVEPHHKAHLAHTAPRSSTPVPDTSSAQDFPSLGGSSGGGSSSAATAAAAAAAAAQQQQLQRQAAAAAAQRQAQQQQQQQQQQLLLDEQSLFTGAPVNFALQGSSSVGLPPPFTLAVSSPLAAAPDAASLSALDAPVQMPSGFSTSGGGSVSGLGLTHSAPVAPTSGSGLEELRLNLTGLNTSPSATTAAAAAAPAGPAPAHGGPLHLLHLLAQRREAAASASAGSGNLSPAGDQPVSRLGFASHNLGSSAAVGTPTGASSAALGASRANGSISSSGGGGRVGVSGQRSSSSGKGGVLRGVLETLEQVSEALCCPITHEVFVDPVVAADGITYERKAIVDWLGSHNTSPMTNSVLPNLLLHPNSLVKTLVEELL